MALNSVGSYTLGEINVGFYAALGLMNPLLIQLDLLLTGQFGLGAFMLDAQIAFNAAISAVAQLGLTISDPTIAITALISAIGQLQATLAAALALSVPTISLQVSAQIAAMAALAGTLTAKLGGLQAMLAAGLAVKIPALQFLAQMNATLSAGPVHLLSFTGDTLTVTGAQIDSQFSTGLGPSNPISPGESVSGILLVTKDPAVFAALSAILKTS